MRFQKVISGDAGFISPRYSQDARQVPGRYRVSPQPPIHGNRHHSTFLRYLFVRSDKRKDFCNFIFHDPNNDYISHSVKWLIP